MIWQDPLTLIRDMGSQGITISRHPEYHIDELTKYRFTYSHTAEFVKRYLYKRYNEDEDAWRDRKKLAYNPAFAREAIDEFARAIGQRSIDISRSGGSPVFLDQCDGRYNGVDKAGSTMNTFFSSKVIPELLAMGKVGIYIDNERLQGNTLKDTYRTLPYLYVYQAEHILNWSYSNNEIQSVLLRDLIEKTDDFGLPGGLTYKYRHLHKGSKGKVQVDFYNEKGEPESSTKLSLDRIPFVFLSLPWSLLRDTADYQIALLNLASADFYYAYTANFPVYTEQYDPHDISRITESNEDDNPPEKEEGLPGSMPWDKRSKKKIGVMSGVEYPKETERPGWIHPSPEPLIVGMKKEDQLKHEIRQLTALALTNYKLQQESAESKAKDRATLESGISVVGMVLETAENTISRHWHAYKANKMEPTQIKYPERYELRTEEDRRQDAKEMKELQYAVPSRTFHKIVAKQISSTLHGHRVDREIIKKMHEEIENSEAPTSDPEVLRQDHEAGFVSDKLASIARGYPEGEAEQAREDHAARLARIKAAQQAENTGEEGARGDKDEDKEPGRSAKKEKERAHNPDEEAE